MKPLLLILRPRDIPRCIAAIGALDVDKLWFEYMTEASIAGIFAPSINVAEARGYTHAVLLSDDTVPSQDALDLVLAHALDPNRQVVTAYCNLDQELPFVNITKRPFGNLHLSAKDDYDFYTRAEVDAHAGRLVPTFFAGACLTCMPIELWKRYPFQVLGGKGHPGYASDYRLSVRLQQDGMPIVAPRGAFVEHVKEVWNKRDLSPEKRLLIGERPSAVRWDVG